MKIRPLLVRFALALILCTAARGQDAASDLKSLVTQIQNKIKTGQRSATDLAPELAAFDALLAKYENEKSEEVAQIAFMRATLYLQILGDTEKGQALLTQIKTDFPETKAAAVVDDVLDRLTQAAKAKEARSGVIGKPAPELHFTWSSSEGLKTLSGLKGKVVVLDFWATWCGPCITSFPQVRELVEHYKDASVVVLGVTSLQGRVVNLESKPINTKGDPEKEMSLMPAFIKAKGMTWPVVFSKENVFNPDYGVNGIPHLAIIAPDGTVRHNGLHPGMAHADKVEKIDAILKEFNLPLPARKKA